MDILFRIIHFLEFHWRRLLCIVVHIVYNLAQHLFSFYMYMYVSIILLLLLFYEYELYWIMWPVYCSNICIDDIDVKWLMCDSFIVEIGKKNVLPHWLSSDFIIITKCMRFLSLLCVILNVDHSLYGLYARMDWQEYF